MVRELYRTAQVQGNIFTHNGEHDLPAGEIVEVKYRCEAYNALHKKNMAVYSVFHAGTYWGDLYETALTGFVL